MMTTEVTNAMYAEFDPAHDSRYIDQQSKDHTRPGYVANAPNQPVIRITWKRANEFCQLAQRQDGTQVPPADRGRMGMGLPCRFRDAHVVGTGRR